MGVGVDTTTVLAQVADQLMALDMSGWPDAALEDVFLGLRREIDRLECAASGWLAAIEGRGIPFARGAASTSAWVQWQAGQRWPDARDSLRAGKARQLLPLTSRAWAEGSISGSAARTIARGVKAGHEEVYAELESYLVDAAGAHHFRHLDAIIGHYRKCAAELDDREPSDQNGVYLSEVHKRWALKGDLDAEGGNTLNKALDAAMDPPGEGDERSLAKRRADAIVAIARFYLDHADTPLEGGERPHVQLVLRWSDLAGLPLSRWPDDLGDVHDLGAYLSAAQRDRILCDCNISRIILGPDSLPLDVGREHRTAPRWLRRAPSPNATLAVASPAATGPRTAAKSTMSSPGGKAAPPTSPTVCS